MRYSLLSLARNALSGHKGWTPQWRDAEPREGYDVETSADGESVLEFTCIGESREASRVMAVASGFSFTGISDESLRGWLASAPRVGRLEEKTD